MTSSRPPNRASVEKGSRFFYQNCSSIRVSIDGVEQLGVVREYCVSGGWARVIQKGPAGVSISNVLGNGPRIKTVHGEVKVWFR